MNPSSQTIPHRSPLLSLLQPASQLPVTLSHLLSFINQKCLLRCLTLKPPTSITPLHPSVPRSLTPAPCKLFISCHFQNRADSECAATVVFTPSRPRRSFSRCTMLVRVASPLPTSSSAWLLPAVALPSSLLACGSLLLVTRLVLLVGYFSTSAQLSLNAHVISKKKNSVHIVRRVLDFLRCPLDSWLWYRCCLCCLSRPRQGG